MRPKLYASVIAAAAIAVMGIGSAAATASTVNFMGENTTTHKGEVLKAGSFVTAKSGDLRFNMGGGFFACAETNITGKITKNASSPAYLNSLTSGSVKCIAGGGSYFSVKVASVATQSTFTDKGASGEGKLQVKLEFSNASFFGGVCSYVGPLLSSWQTTSEWQGKATNLYFGASSNPVETSGSISCPTLSLEGNFSLRDAAGNPVQIVTLP